MDLRKSTPTKELTFSAQSEIDDLREQINALKFVTTDDQRGRTENQRPATPRQTIALGAARAENVTSNATKVETDSATTAMTDVVGAPTAMTIATADPDHPAIFGASAASDSTMQLGHHHRNPTIIDLPTTHTNNTTTTTTNNNNNNNTRLLRIFRKGESQ